MGSIDPVNISLLNYFNLEAGYDLHIEGHLADLVIDD